MSAAVLLLIALALAQASTPATALDYGFFRANVQPIFLAKRPGHARCVACHTGSTGNRMPLQPLSPGSTTWDEEQSRKNFDACSNMINSRDVDASPLLVYPLAEKAGGNHFHPGGKHWESKSAAEFRILSEWAHGQKATASSK